jgi:hypothetical protein
MGREVNATGKNVGHKKKRRCVDEYVADLGEEFVSRLPLFSRPR